MPYIINRRFPINTFSKHSIGIGKIRHVKGENLTFKGYANHFRSANHVIIHVGYWTRNFTDRKVDIIEGGYDLAFRIGSLPDSSLKARKITPIRHVICASPDYLKQHGRPETPAQLKRHKILKQVGWPLAGMPLWDLDGQKHLVNGDASLIANNGNAMTLLALAGHGIIMLPTFYVWESLQRGDLVPILEDYSMTTIHAYAIYPATRYMPLKVRSLIDFLIDRFGDAPYWDRI